VSKNSGAPATWRTPITGAGGPADVVVGCGVFVQPAAAITVAAMTESHASRDVPNPTYTPTWWRDRHLALLSSCRHRRSMIPIQQTVYNRPMASPRLPTGAVPDRGR
jgi:hypothetical protein